jgi:hypothetical protein
VGDVDGELLAQWESVRVFDGVADAETCADIVSDAV